MKTQFRITTAALIFCSGFSFCGPALSDNICDRHEAAVTPNGAVEVIPGALQKERSEVLSKIMKAKAQGCGVSSYMAEFGRIQDAVKSNQADSQLKPRIASLSKGLDEQIERGRLLKSKYDAPQSYSANGSAPSQIGDPARQAMGFKSKKFAGQIAMNWTTDQWMKRSIKAREMLKKFQNQKPAK